MKKLVIFNVGGALACYGQFDERRFIIDLGSGNGFYPVDNFLIPLSRSYTEKNAKSFRIDQVFLSHLDRDHISQFKRLIEEFGNPSFTTCPNDSLQIDRRYRVNRQLLGPFYEIREFVLDHMSKLSPKDPRYPHMSMENPLISTIPGLRLFYIRPPICEFDVELNKGYTNNISLVIFIRIADKTVLFPGDLLKAGFDYVIGNIPQFVEEISTYGVDYLIAPHHGLQTSFSERLFATMKGGKTRLNIISEKTRESTSNESRSDVDTRYYSKEYSTGQNSLKQFGIKTSTGHVVIDFEQNEDQIKVIQNLDELIQEFEEP